MNVWSESGLMIIYLLLFFYNHISKYRPNIVIGSGVIKIYLREDFIQENYLSMILKMLTYVVFNIFHI